VLWRDRVGRHRIGGARLHWQLMRRSRPRGVMGYWTGVMGTREGRDPVGRQSPARELTAVCVSKVRLRQLGLH
jgi:hypothetical protein